jgi:hypothetical protein
MSNIVFEEKISFLRTVFGTVSDPKGAGQNASINCPACKKQKKLAIHLLTDVCHCWVCGLGTKLISLLMKYHPSYVHEYITRFAGKQVFFIDEKIKFDVVLPENFKLLATNINNDDFVCNKAIDYLKKRGLKNRDLWFFKFGVSSDQNIKDRVVMPSFDCDGKLNFYTARAITNNFRKYMNCDAEKKSIIFNEINIDWSKELTLVEGPFDLTKCDENATCLLGSSLSEDSKLFYKIYQNKTPIVLALDNDMVDKSWQRIAKLLNSYDINVKILQLGNYKDVGEMSKEEFLFAKLNAKEWSRDSALLQKIKSFKS